MVDFSWENNRLSLTSGNAVTGIDVSSHQGVIDWAAVAQDGISFAFVRLGYRGYETGTLLEDEFARQNLEGARAAGLKVGAYFFSQALNETEAREEAALCLTILDGFSLDLPLVYDWEFVTKEARTGNVDRQTLTACTQAFRYRVAPQYESAVYFNRDQANRLLNLQELEELPWWLAQYGTEMELPFRVDLWQYSSGGQVKGIEGDVDLDLMFTDYGLGKTLFGS